jgi:catechol 2,3-dioxygenase-like lactoylglutathione lyase family enzyme
MKEMKVTTKIHHIAVAVKDVEAAVKPFCEALGVEAEIREYVPHNLRWAVLPVGDSEIQLCQNILTPSDEWPAELAAVEQARRYSDFIEENGEGIHHIALEVDDLSETLAVLAKGSLKTAGGPITDDKATIEPRARLVFADESGLHGVNVEWIQITQREWKGPSRFVREGNDKQ